MALGYPDLVDGRQRSGKMFHLIRSGKHVIASSKLDNILDLDGSCKKRKCIKDFICDSLVSSAAVQLPPVPEPQRELPRSFSYCEPLTFVSLAGVFKEALNISKTVVTGSSLEGKGDHILIKGGPYPPKSLFGREPEAWEELGTDIGNHYSDEGPSPDAVPELRY